MAILKIRSRFTVSILPRLIATLSFCLFAIVHLNAHANGSAKIQPCKSKKQKRDKPNIVLILIDDLGWTDVGCYGNQVVDTPNIDNLARQGIRFTNFYASGAVCSPTRCAIQSGQNQARLGMTAHIPGHWRPFEKVQTPKTRMALPLDIVTVAEAVKQSGYSTGYIGKWHLGWGPQFQPSRQGYDFSAVINGPHLPGRFRVSNKELRQPAADQYRTDYEADLCDDFIQQQSDRPFFLMVSPFAVHIPLGAMSAKVVKYQRLLKQQNKKVPHPVYAAMIEHCDDMVGRIISSLTAHGKIEDTVIIFTSDNGGLIKRYDYREAADDIVSSLAPLRGEKGSLYEGGLRIPCIISGPGIDHGVSDQPAISHDFYPTIVELAGAQLPKNQTIDVVSLTTVLTISSTRLKRQTLFWHYPHYHHDRPASCLRSGNWKLIEFLDGSSDIELFDLANDLSEANNLADTKPGIKKDLLLKLRRWRESVSAAMPHPNPMFDPDRRHEWWSMRSGKPVPSDERTRFPATEVEDRNR